MCFVCNTTIIFKYSDKLRLRRFCLSHRRVRNILRKRICSCFLFNMTPHYCFYFQFATYITFINGIRDAQHFSEQQDIVQQSYRLSCMTGALSHWYWKNSTLPGIIFCLLPTTVSFFLLQTLLSLQPRCSPITTFVSPLHVGFVIF